MVLLLDESVNEFREIFKKEYGKELTMQEASDSAHNLVNFFDVLLKIESKDQERQHRLKKEPKGFHVYDGIYNCVICHKAVTGDESWYDKYRVKCLTCQKATDKGIIPAKVFKNRKNWYAMWELKDKFGIHSATARKMIRTGELKAIIIENEDGKPYEYIFLADENKEVLKSG
ncbi:MAG: hypothetical protein ACD_15C00154G0002 [uncultured bacterium]|nr:MAG: hypothetical protein ACD_15C00154G0002 [uncultured bacterium]